MRAIIVTAVLMVASAGAAVARTVSVTLASRTRRDALQAAEYQSFWHYLALGGGYEEWRDKRVIFALYLGTPDRSAYLECCEALGKLCTRGLARVEWLAGAKRFARSALLRLRRGPLCRASLVDRAPVPGKAAP